MSWPEDYDDPDEAFDDEDCEESICPDCDGTGASWDGLCICTTCDGEGYLF